MTDQAQRLEIATVRAEIGSNITYRFNNDAIDAGGIPTESGDIKNLKLIIKEIEDKASVSSSIYATVAEGLSATAEGGMFLVQSGEDDEIYVVWRKVDGAAVDTGKRTLSSQAAEDAVNAAQSSADASAASATIAQAAADSAEAEFQGLSLPDGGYFVGWGRSVLASAASTVGKMLSAQSVNIWEFADLVTNKPITTDPSTWDWTPAIQAAANSVSVSAPRPDGGMPAIYFPSGVYKLTSVVFPDSSHVFCAGALFKPFDVDSTHEYLFKFLGFNRVDNLVIDMGFSLSYDKAIWVRGRHSGFSKCTVWAAKSAWVFGDPSWENDPTKGHLGDSENVMTCCETVWCVNGVRAYGQNTILHFNDCLIYSYKSAFGEVDPSNPNVSAWNALKENTFISCGALIYLNGGCAANFTSQNALLLSKLQPVSAANYVNSFGKFYLNGTHVETGALFLCDILGAYTADDSKSKVLTLSQVNGYSTVAGNTFINVGGDCKQGVHVDGSCGIYGNTSNNIVYATKAPTHVDVSAFSNISVDFFQAFHAMIPVGYDRFCAMSANGTAQTFGSSDVALIMPSRQDSDVWASFESSWYSTSTGTFTAVTAMRNVEFSVSLLYSSAVATDTTTFYLVVDGVQQDIAVSHGVNPRVVLKIRKLNKNSNVVINVRCSPSRTASGSASSKLMVVGAV